MDPDALGVAEDLARRLVQGDHEAALTAPGPFRDELQGHDALPRPRDPDDECRARHEIPAVHQLIEAGDARRYQRGCVELGAPFALQDGWRLDSSSVFEVL